MGYARVAQLLINRSQRLAVSTPRSVELNESRPAPVDNLIECGRSECNHVSISRAHREGSKEEANCDRQPLEAEAHDGCMHRDYLQLYLEFLVSFGIQ